MPLPVMAMFAHTSQSHCLPAPTLAQPEHVQPVAALQLESEQRGLQFAIWPEQPMDDDITHFRMYGQQ